VHAKPTIASVDTRIEEMGGIVLRRVRGEVIDAQLERDVKTLRTELASLRDEQSRALKDQRAKLDAKIERAKSELHAAQDRAKAALDAATREGEAKLRLLEERLGHARGDAKTKIDARIKATRAEYQRRSELLRQAGELARQAVAGQRHGYCSISGGCAARPHGPLLRTWDRAPRLRHHRARDASADHDRVGGVVRRVRARGGRVRNRDRFFGARRWSGVLLHLLSGIAGIVLGVLLLAHPAAGAVGLTLAVAALFMVAGIARVAIAIVVRFPSWGWALASGLVTALFGAWIAAGWPATSLITIGTLVAIEMILRGWGWIMLARQMRRVSKTVAAGSPLLAPSA
jgi:hypothetical protein